MVFFLKIFEPFLHLRCHWTSHLNMLLSSGVIVSNTFSFLLFLLLLLPMLFQFWSLHTEKTIKCSNNAFTYSCSHISQCTPKFISLLEGSCPPGIFSKRNLRGKFLWPFRPENTFISSSC